MPEEKNVVVQVPPELVEEFKGAHAEEIDQLRLDARVMLDTGTPRPEVLSRIQKTGLSEEFAKWFVSAVTASGGEPLQFETKPPSKNYDILAERDKIPSPIVGIALIGVGVLIAVAGYSATGFKTGTGIGVLPAGMIIWGSRILWKNQRLI